MGLKLKLHTFFEIFIFAFLWQLTKIRYHWYLHDENRGNAPVPRQSLLFHKNRNRAGRSGYSVTTFIIGSSWFNKGMAVEKKQLLHMSLMQTVRAGQNIRRSWVFHLPQDLHSSQISDCHNNGFDRSISPSAQHLFNWNSEDHVSWKHSGARKKFPLLPG